MGAYKLLARSRTVGGTEMLEIGLTLPTWGVLVGATVVTLYMHWTWNHNTFKKLGVKGPKPLPMLGNVLDLFKRSPAEVDLDYVKTYGKVHGVFAGRAPTLIVGDADVAQEILIKNFTYFINRTQFPVIQQKPLDRMLSVICGDHWRHVRASLSPSYSSGKLKQMMPTITNCANEMMTHLHKHDGSAINVKEVLSGYTMDVIAGTAFGLDTRSLENPDNAFLMHAKRFFAFATHWSAKTLLAIVASMISERLALALAKFGIRIIDGASVKYMDGVVRDALKDGAKDRQNFAKLCLDQHVDIRQVSRDTVKMTADGLEWTSKGLTTDEIISNSIVFLMAGFDTVSTFLSFFCYAMAANADAQVKAYDEIAANVNQEDFGYDQLKSLTYLDMCMDETLRMYPPAMRLDRQCSKACTIGGIQIPAGMTINVSVCALHNDPDHWSDPHVFKPERFLPEETAKRHPCAYLPFGAGPRNCIGMRLAMLEAKTAIVKIMSKYRICMCDDTPRPPLKLSPSFGFLAPALPIRLTFKRRGGAE